MGTYEDFYWDMTKLLEENGLKKDFDTQLKKMSSQDKHKYKDTRDRWSYAYDKVWEKHKKKNGN